MVKQPLHAYYTHGQWIHYFQHSQQYTLILQNQKLEKLAIEKEIKP